MKTPLEQAQAFSDISAEVTSIGDQRMVDAEATSTELARVADLLNRSGTDLSVFNEFYAVTELLEAKGQEGLPGVDVGELPILQGLVERENDDFDQFVAEKGIEGLVELLRKEYARQQTDDGIGRIRRHTRMDVIRAVSLFSRLHYDARLVIDSEQEIGHGGHEVGVNVVSLAEQIIPRDLAERKAALLTETHKKALYERRAVKLRAKYDEIFDPASDYGHILMRAERYIEGPRGEFEGASNPTEILASIHDVDNVDWAEIIFNLRALALYRSIDLFEEMYRAVETDA